MKKMTDNSSIETKVSRFLFRYRITPHTTTGQSSAQLLMNRQLKIRLALARPSIEKRVQSKQEKQKRGHDKRTRQRTFNVGDAVYARNFAHGSKWIPGQIVAKRGPLSFTLNAMMVVCGIAILIMWFYHVTRVLMEWAQC